MLSLNKVYNDDDDDDDDYEWGLHGLGCFVVFLFRL